MKKIIITSLLITYAAFAFTQSIPSDYVSQVNQKIQMISTFRNSSLPLYFIDCGGNDVDILQQYTNYAPGFGIHFYDQQKEKLNKGSNLLISIVREPFIEFLENYSAQYKELLGKDYTTIINRLDKGEAFYIYQQGKVNKLILCGQEVKDIDNLVSDAFSTIFPAGSADADGDGLPDFFEKMIGTDPNKIDTDGDGLSDYEEYFKYGTNPLLKDSDNDGIPDSEWNERREYAYSIYVKREIIAPFNPFMMNDLFQDTRVLKQSGDTLWHETILYPNTINFIIPLAKNESVTDPQVSKYTQPSFFCNYTPDMKNELQCITATWDIRNNYELLNSFARYAVVISNHYPSMEPLNFYINVIDDKVNIVYRDRFDQFKTQHFTTDESILENLTFGASMYKNRMRGACGSSAIFFNTLLRSLDFPTRIVVSNPIIDYTDDEQVKLIGNLKNEHYKDIALSKRDMLRGYANHFFYETNINGSWIRCDYDNVNLSCVHVQGLFIVQDKIRDFGESDYTRTWGKSMVENKGNVYKTLDLSDQSPIH